VISEGAFDPNVGGCMFLFGIHAARWCMEMHRPPHGTHSEKFLT
jgi:thiamine biosynthesis lipoprotein ApbE